MIGAAKAARIIYPAPHDLPTLLWLMDAGCVFNF